MANESVFNALETDLLMRIGLSVDFSSYTDDDWCDLEEKVGDYLLTRCLDENYFPNADGLLCEEILDKLSTIA